MHSTEKSSRKQLESEQLKASSNKKRSATNGKGPSTKKPCAPPKKGSPSQDLVTVSPKSVLSKQKSPTPPYTRESNSSATRQGDKGLGKVIYIILFQEFKFIFCFVYVFSL